MDEVSLSGGFLSFDQPIVHFGLGENDHALKLTVRWSTGEHSVIDMTFDAGFHYEITRQ